MAIDCGDVIALDLVLLELVLRVRHCCSRRRQLRRLLDDICNGGWALDDLLIEPLLTLLMLLLLLLVDHWIAGGLHVGVEKATFDSCSCVQDG